MSKFANGEISKLTEPVSFEIKYLNQSSFPATDWDVYDKYVSQVADIRKAFSAANAIHRELGSNLNHIQTAILDMPAAPGDLIANASALKQQLHDLDRTMNGDATLARNQFETPPSISDRIGRAEYGLWEVTSEPTQVYREAYRIAAKQFGPALTELKRISREVDALEKQLEINNAPYTPGRWPTWGGE
jgi:hypothetical protein